MPPRIQDGLEGGSSRRYYHRNRAKSLERQRKWREKNPGYEQKRSARRRKQNPEKIKEYQRRYREKKREELRAAGRLERALHPERVAARQRKYIEKDGERYLLISRKNCHARNARKRAAGGKFSEDDVLALQRRQRGRCYWCNLPHGETYQIDHVWPLSRGGSNGPENICIACKKCNLKKNDKTPMEWAGRLL